MSICKRFSKVSHRVKLNANLVQILGHSKIGVFYRLERLLFNLKRDQTPFLSLFRQKRMEEKMTSF